MKNFTLVNPYIKGTFDTNFKGKSELEAAQKTWASLGKNITQNLPKYCFTLERSSDKKLFHFSVKEEVNDGVVDYKLGSIKVNAKSKKLKAFKNKLKELKNADKKHQDGGKRKKRRMTTLQVIVKVVITMYFQKNIKNILKEHGVCILSHGIGMIH